MNSRISIRLFVDLPDLVEAAAFGQTTSERLAAVAGIVQLETRPYWKIPGWFEVFLIAQPSTNTKPASVFNSMLSSLGQGWTQCCSGDEEYQWAVWNPAS